MPCGVCFTTWSAQYVDGHLLCHLQPATPRVTLLLLCVPRKLVDFAVHVFYSECLDRVRRQEEVCVTWLISDVQRLALVRATALLFFVVRMKFEQIATTLVRTVLSRLQNTLGKMAPQVSLISRSSLSSTVCICDWRVGLIVVQYVQRKSRFCKVYV